MNTTKSFALSAAALLALSGCALGSSDDNDADTSNADQERIEELEAELESMEQSEESEPVSDTDDGDHAVGTEASPEVEADDEDLSSDEESGGDSDLGTRDEPLSIGETASNGAWEATVNSVTRDQGGVIAEENQFNEPAPEGTAYALVEVTFTYLGDGSTELWGNTGLTYVTETGETVKASDNSVVTPGELDTYTELYTDGSASGVLAIAMPHEDHGTVRIDMAQTEDWMDGMDEAWFASVED